MRLGGAAGAAGRGAGEVERAAVQLQHCAQVLAEAGQVTAAAAADGVCRHAGRARRAPLPALARAHGRAPGPGWYEAVAMLVCDLKRGGARAKER